MGEGKGVGIKWFLRYVLYLCVSRLCPEAEPGEEATVYVRVLTKSLLRSSHVRVLCVTPCLELSDTGGGAAQVCNVYACMYVYCIVGITYISIQIVNTPHLRIYPSTSFLLEYA